MNRLEKYIINNLSMLFLSIFSALFTIASVIFLIKLATYTAIIQLTVWEMAKLYIFVVPELLFYTLPITFFVSAALTIFRLSHDNELIVLFALGIHPKFILKTLFKPALLLTLLLVFTFFVLFPHTKTLSKNFISYKKSEAKFNLAASEFGHKFGNWLLYLGSKNDDETYSDIFLFNKNAEEEVLIGAKKANIINDSGILRLKLTDGEGYSYSKEKFSQIDFNTMYINDTFTSEIIPYNTTIDYWKEYRGRDKKIPMFITNALLSLFPIFSLFFVLSISVVHARHQKSKIYLYLFLGILVYYGLTLSLHKTLLFYTIPILSFAWLFSTYLIYKKTILRRF
ncbi:MAG: LptF/LptG family permease [Helicobacteraceae bacterium]|nr:LptF/LptG family permease [Candidatus Sulfurimonas ponti]